MALNIVELPYSYFPDFSRGRPLFNADIYVGNVDTDPEIPANQKQVTVRQEDGTEVQIAQPVKTSAGGVPTYNGSPVTVLVDGSYSIKVLDRLGAEEYYSPDVTKGVPLTPETLPAYTDLVFDSVPDMIAYSDHSVGNVYQSGIGRWKVVNTPVSSILDFAPIGDIFVDDFNLDKTGGANVFADFQEIAEVTNTYGPRVIDFGDGKYNASSGDQTDISNWIRFRNGVELRGVDGECDITSAKILVDGDFGPLINIGATGATTGDTTIQWASAHGLEVGDYFQMLSQRNAFTSDGLDYQLGSENPTDQTTSQVRFSEIHQVSEVVSTTEVKISLPVIYPEYADNTTGLTSPIAGVTSAQLRKIDFVNGFKTSGIKWSRNESNFRGFYLRACRGYEISGDFQTEGNPGRHLRTAHCLDGTLEGVTTTREPVGASGSSWNSFIFGSGEQNLTVKGNAIKGDFQSVDITNAFAATTDAGFNDNADLNCDGITSQIFKITDNKWFGNSDGFTTHPGTYDLTFTNNEGIGNNTFARIRSRKNKVSLNVSMSVSAGYVFSAFYEDTDFSLNTVICSGGSSSWDGVSIVPLSSEIMNNNNVQRFTIQSNSFINAVNQDNARGIQFRHFGNGVPPAGFTGFTDEIKQGESKFIIQNNTFNGTTLLCNKWINGSFALDNKFINGNSANQDQYYINFLSNSAKNTVLDNQFLDNSLDGIQTNNVFDPAVWPYDTTHRVGSQESPRGAITNSLNNLSQSFVTGNSTETKNEKDVFSNGSGVSASRGSGDATLRLDATPQDGTSIADVRVNNEAGTTGDKFLSVDGDLRGQSANVSICGTASRPWAGGNTQTAFNITSDERLKTELLSIPDEVLDAWEEVKWSQFKFLDRVNEKGDKARTHIGLGAQSVISVFESHGLDPFEYGIVGKDVWEEITDEGTNEIIQECGERYNIRYEEALAMEAALMRRELKKLKS